MPVPKWKIWLLAAPFSLIPALIASFSLIPALIAYSDSREDHTIADDTAASGDVMVPGAYFNSSKFTTFDEILLTNTLVGPSNTLASMTVYNSDDQITQQTVVGQAQVPGSLKPSKINYLTEPLSNRADRLRKSGSGSASFTFELSDIAPHLNITFSMGQPEAPHLVDVYQAMPATQHHDGKVGSYTHSRAKGGFDLGEHNQYTASIEIGTADTFSITDNRGCVFQGIITERAAVRGHVEMFNFTARASHCMDTEHESGVSLNSVLFTGVGALKGSDQVFLIGHNGSASIGLIGTR